MRSQKQRNHGRAPYEPVDGIDRIYECVHAIDLLTSGRCAPAPPERFRAIEALVKCAHREEGGCDLRCAMGQSYACMVSGALPKR